MALELYLDLISQPCRSVYLFAKANRIPFEMKTVDLLHGQHLTDDFAKVNSLKKVPAMKDGDFTLAESSAILRYLSQKYNTPDHWYPKDLQARARVEEYLFWHADSILGTFNLVLWIRVLGPLIDIHIPKEKVDRNIAFMKQALQNLEQKFLQDKPFLAGDQISVADLMALEELMQTFYAGFDVFEGRPKLAAWRGRVEATLGEKLCHETREAIRKLCAEPKSLKDTLVIHDWMRLRLSRIP